MTFPITPNGSRVTPSGVIEPTGPYDELGRPSNLQLVYSTRGQRQYGPKWADPNPQLQFPGSVKIYSVMTRTDEQVDSVLRAISLPVLDARWDLDDDGVKPGVASYIRDEIGLCPPGEALKNRVRSLGGIVFSDHIREALDCLAYGFAPFEIVKAATFPGDLGHPDDPLFAGQPAIHLRKLAARPPATVRRIVLDRDGGLVSIIQYPPVGEPLWYDQPDGEMGIEIPVDRLVMYVNDRKGADWSGVSILRTAYRPWKIKEQLCRLDAIAAERNSLGLPVVHYDPSVMTHDAALELASNARAGAEAGIALPQGVSFELVGVSGSVPDLGPKIDRYNQAIGRASLAMFLNLGHDNGARSLGDTFLGFFTRSLQAIAGQLAETFTEHVIRDLVEANFGPDEPYPRLVPGEITTEMALDPVGIRELVSANVIVPDDDLEEQIRRRYRLPTADAGSARIPTNPAARMPFQPEVVPGTPNELPKPAEPPPPPAPVVAPVPAPNPFAPVPPGATTPVPPGAAAEPSVAAADEPPPPAPRTEVRVPAHIRKWPAARTAREPSLSGYAAWLHSQVEDIETEHVNGADPDPALDDLEASWT